MRIYLWVEKVTLRGSRDKSQYIGKAMTASGVSLAQHPYSSVEWAKIGLGYGDGNEVNRLTYEEAYPLGYELIWLDDHLHSGLWWMAVFFSRRRYRIRWQPAADGDPAFFEFRDEKTEAILGYVVHQSFLRCWYVLPGRRSPRGGDLFPDPAYGDLVLAMQVANKTFTPKEDDDV